MKTIRWMIMITITTALLFGCATWAGDLIPPGAPGASMHTLEEIYQRLAVLESNQTAIVSNQTAIEGKLASAGFQQTLGNMVLIPAGSFVMGDAFGEGRSNELPLHTNSISAFYMDKYGVTSNKWAEVYTWATANGYSFSNAGSAKGATHPVHTVNWYDCVAWANARSQFDGITPCYTNTDGMAYTNSTVAFAGDCIWSADGYRLPTEAEWEKAARGGASGRRFPWKDANTIQHARANYNSSSSYSYDTSPTKNFSPPYNTGSLPYTSPVGSFEPNGYGLYDMAGNVFEWCWDWHGSAYYASSPGTNPTGPVSGSSRAVRGGDWSNSANICRVANRGSFSPDSLAFRLGFRLVRSAP